LIHIYSFLQSKIGKGFMKSSNNCFTLFGQLSSIGLISVCLVALFACGESQNKASSTTGSTTSPSDPASSSAATGSLALGLIDVASSADKNSISLSSSTQLKAVLKDSAGKPIPNQVVRFVPDTKEILTLTPASSALTDENGIATVFVAPAGLTIAGAYSITAESVVGSASYKATRNFSIGVNNVSISSLTVSSPNISAYGTTTISAVVAGLPAGSNTKVSFTSTCSSNGRAVITAIADTVKGTATATYKDNACAGTDTIAATVQGTSVTSNTTVTSNAPAIANIGFVSASPQTIILKGTGAASASEISIVRFRVYDQSGQPYTVPTAVTFNLSTFTGGLLLDNASASITKPSNGVGEVEVAVSAGTLPTPVTVKASITDPVSGAIRTTESIKLSVSTGRPTQNFFSLAASAFNIEGWNYDGTKSLVTVRGADRLANPVPDGTSVNFIAEGASIGATCQTTAGACSVDFVSQQSRPIEGLSSRTDSINRTESGRVTVLSYAIGEESFLDLNGNNLYDPGETFNDLGYIFIDNLETATYEVSRHQVIPFTNPPGPCVNPIVGSYSVPSIASTCDGKWGTAQVRRAAVFVLSGSRAFLAKSPLATYGEDSVDTNLVISRSICRITRPFFLQDTNGNPMAAGTKVEADVKDARFTSASVGNSPVADSTARGGTFHFLSVNATDSFGNCVGTGEVKVVVTSTKGIVTTFSFPMTLIP
jgi:Bacterial Ig-like domain (group 1)